ncbi:hypothetical protein Taro_049601 [Colocasia esculenta]|uniref:Uncharacterized protein n=1 Tax=Colocasia esculenta TaxID=4460 RepID=A0A843XBF9_COLES|nr:hypothetical protein [Colocasia esculenta]
MERHKPIPQLSFPCCIRTPKTHRCLNTLQQTLGSSSTTCWGRVEELLAAGEQEIMHTKPILFPLLSVATCTNRPLEVDQRWTRFKGPLKSIHEPGRDLGLDQSMPRVGLHTAWESGKL